MVSQASSDDDKQFAKDMQLAYKLQAKEDRREHRREQKQRENDENTLTDGFSASKLNPDHMLFVKCLIDNREVDLLIDTGASASAMSVAMVNVLNLQPKCNESIYGNATGVGSSNILGIVENVDCMIGHVEFRLFFMVLEGNMPYCILGLDQMRRFRCNVDLDDNVLVFGGKGGVSVSFLPKEEAKIAAFKMINATAFKMINATKQQPQQPPREREKKEGKLKSFFRR
jgi:hypothetical protein